MLQFVLWNVILRQYELVVAIPNTKIRIGMSYQYLTLKGLLQGGSSLEFVSSSHVLANNYLTHILSGKGGGVEDLTEDDLNTAIQILKEKFIVARWADKRKVAKYVVQNEGWDPRGFKECIYPPENPYSKEAAIASQNTPPPPPPPKTAEELAIEAAISLRNSWDNRPFEIMQSIASEELASIE